MKAALDAVALAVVAHRLAQRAYDLLLLSDNAHFTRDQARWRLAQANEAMERAVIIADQLGVCHVDICMAYHRGVMTEAEKP